MVNALYILPDFLFQINVGIEITTLSEIIADHGNADNALNPDGSVNTAHSLNPVPFVYVTANKDAKVENGVLADVAPSILHILGLPQPAEMDGKDLIK